MDKFLGSAGKNNKLNFEHIRHSPRTLAEYLLGSSSWLNNNQVYPILHFMSEHAFTAKTGFLTPTVLVTCRNALLNQSGGPYLVSLNISHCKFYGGPCTFSL